MESLIASFYNLSPARRRRVHLLLCRHALSAWERYQAEVGPIRYVDSVVGLEHELDPALPADAYAGAERGAGSGAVWQRYLEPLAALQDSDLELPGRVEMAFYAIYNLYRKYARGDQIADWLIVNQALSAEENPERWRPMLAEAIQLAGDPPTP